MQSELSKLFTVGTDPASPTPSPSGDTASLSSSLGLPILITLGAIILVVGLLLVANAWPKRNSKRVARRSVVRSWLAITLVIGLLTFIVVAFIVPDESVRSTLVGALAAAVGTALAYYFSAQAAQDAATAAHDQNAIASPKNPVPNLAGMTAPEALRVLGTTAFLLAGSPTALPSNPGDTIVRQTPASEESAVAGTQVMVGFQPPA